MKKVNKILLAILVVFISTIYVNAKEIKEISLYVQNLPEEDDWVDTWNDRWLDGFIEDENISCEKISGVVFGEGEAGTKEYLEEGDQINIRLVCQTVSYNDYIPDNVTVKLNGKTVTAPRDFTNKDAYEYSFYYTVPKSNDKKTLYFFVDGKLDDQYDVLTGSKFSIKDNITEYKYNYTDRNDSSDSDVFEFEYIEDITTHQKYKYNDVINVTANAMFNVYYKKITLYKIRYYLDGELQQIYGTDYRTAYEGGYLDDYDAIYLDTEYDFDIWYTDPEFKNPVGHEKITKDTNFYTRTGFYINNSYDSYNGKVYIVKDNKIKTSVFVTPGESVTVKAEPGEGFKFLGWADEDDNIVSENAEYTFIPTMENYYFYPKFEVLPSTHEVTFIDSFNEPLEAINYVPDGKKVKKPETNYYGHLSKIYKIIDWYSDEGLTSKYDFNSPVTENKRIYAKSEEVTAAEGEVLYTIEISKYMGGYPVIVKKGDKLPQLAPDEAKFKQVFDGWKVEKNLTSWKSSYNYDNLYEDYDFNTPVYVNFDLFSHYVESFNIKFETNGGNNIEPIVSSNSKNRNLVLPTPVKTGYTFTGWYLDSGLKNKFDEKTYEFKDDITLYAAYVKSEYTLSFNTNGGNTIADKVYEYGAKVDTTNMTEVPVKEGYEFRGWFIDNEFKIQFTELTMSTNVTLYAKWDDMSGSEIVKPVLSVTKGDGASLVITLDKHYVSYTYELQRSTKSNKGFKKVATLTNGSYTDTKLTYGKKYYYRVKVILNGKSEYSAVVNGTPKPNKVQNARFVSAGTKSIKVAWDKVGVTGYEVQRSTSATSGFKRVTTITKNKTLSYTNKKLKSNKTYYYRVRAYKKVSGKKIYGAWSDVVTAKTAPAAPSESIKNLAYKKLNIISTAKGATTYKVYRSTNKKKGYVEVGTSNENGYIDTDLLGGKTYYYKAKACNENGSCSGYSKVISKKVLPPAPTIATLVSNEEKKVTMELILPDDAEGYELYRSTNKKKGYKLIKTSEGISETKVEDSVDAKKTYYYKIRIYKTENGKKVYSGYSIIKNVTSK